MKNYINSVPFGEAIHKVMADTKMKPPERMVMFELLLAAFDTGKSDVRVTRTELAEKLNRDKRSVTRSLSNLIRRGWLLRLERPGEQVPVLRVRMLNAKTS